VKTALLSSLSVLFVVVVVSTIVGIIVAAYVVAVNPVIVVGKNGNIVLDSVDVVLILAIACDNGAVLFVSVYPKKEEAEQRYFTTRIVVSSFYVTNNRKEACI
jgi:hypothetical protein